MLEYDDDDEDIKVYLLAEWAISGMLGYFLPMRLQLIVDEDDGVWSRMS